MPVSARKGRLLRKTGKTCNVRFRPIVLKKLSGNNFLEVSDSQAASDCSPATVLPSSGWQDFYLKVNAPEFFNTIAPKRLLAFLSKWSLSAHIQAGGTLYDSKSLFNLIHHPYIKSIKKNCWQFSNFAWLRKIICVARPASQFTFFVFTP